MILFDAILRLRGIAAVGILIGVMALMVYLGWGLIRAGLSAREGGSWHCPTCDYNLRGLPSNMCPECGTVVRKGTAELGERQPMWGVVAIGAAMLLAAIYLIVEYARSLW
jgi:hypothetical protein